MSDFDASARLILASPMKSLELSVVDSEFREVGHGVGALDVNVVPGIYELRFQAGPQYDKRLVSVAPGQVYEDTKIEVTEATFVATTTVPSIAELVPLAQGMFLPTTKAPTTKTPTKKKSDDD